MPLRARKRGRFFDVPVHDFVLRVHAAEELYGEARAAGMQFWEQLQSYGIRNPAFRTSKGPLELPGDAPETVRRLAALTARAGVGPMFAFQGALTEHVGRRVAGSRREVLVSSGGCYFVIAARRSRLLVHPGDETGENPIAIVIRPELGPQGVFTTHGRSYLPADSGDHLAVVADSCVLADAAAAGTMALLTKREGFRAALTYLRRLPGVHGGLIVRGRTFGVAGGIEIAA